jgi:hypothetical protein
MTQPKVGAKGELHPSRVGEFIANAADDHWSQKIAGIYCPLYNPRAVAESSACVRETLARMAGIDDHAEAAAAIDMCGEETFGRLVAARYRRKAAGEGIAQALRADARRAIDDLNDDWGSATIELFRYRIRERGLRDSRATVRAALERLIVAIDACDAQTIGRLEAARYNRGARDGEPAADHLRTDAAAALVRLNLEPDEGGRPEGFGMELAGECLRHWTRITGETEPRYWSDGGSEAPIVTMTGRVFDGVFGGYDRRDISKFLGVLIKR